MATYIVDLLEGIGFEYATKMGYNEPLVHTHNRRVPINFIFDTIVGLTSTSVIAAGLSTRHFAE